MSSEPIGLGFRLRDISTFPNELASANADSHLFDLVAHGRTIFTVTFGEAPILFPSESSLDMEITEGGID